MIDVVDVAHADTVMKLGPMNPYFIDIQPDAMSGITFGMKKGLNLGVPSPFANSITCSWNVRKPPLPEPHITPTLRLFNLSESIPESSTACVAAIIANCVNISILR